MKGDLKSYATKIRSVHNLNYISPPSYSVKDYFLKNIHTKKVPLPASNAFMDIQTNYWDLVNDYSSSILLVRTF